MAKTPVALLTGAVDGNLHSEELQHLALHTIGACKSHSRRLCLALWPSLCDMDGASSTRVDSGNDESNSSVERGCDDDLAADSSPSDFSEDVLQARCSDMSSNLSDHIVSADEESLSESRGFVDATCYVDAFKFIEALDLMPEEEVFPWIEEQRMRLWFVEALVDDDPQNSSPTGATWAGQALVAPSSNAFAAAICISAQ